MHSFSAAIGAAIRIGAPAEPALLERLAETSLDRRRLLVGALGKLPSSAEGDAALRTLAVAHGRSDALRALRMAAVSALFDRVGESVTREIAPLLADPDTQLRDSLLVVLAIRGDGSAWEAALRALIPSLTSKRRAASIGRLVTVAGFDYLVRCAPDADSCRRLAETLRRAWRRIPFFDREAITQVWPGVTPEGPALADLPPPDPQRQYDWKKSPYATG
jgi:hypothetical protein